MQKIDAETRPCQTYPTVTGTERNTTAHTSAHKRAANLQNEVLGGIRVGLEPMAQVVVIETQSQRILFLHITVT